MANTATVGGDAKLLLRVLVELRRDLRWASQSITEDMAYALKREIQQGIPNQVQGPNLHPWWAGQKGHGEKLLHSGVLASGMEVRKGAVSVPKPQSSPRLRVLSVHTAGYFPDKPYRKGLSMQAIAEIQEYGTLIAVTPKMRLYLAAQKPPLILSPSKRFITIPPRPFFQPGFDRAVAPGGPVTKVFDRLVQRWSRIVLRRSP